MRLLVIQHDDDVPPGLLGDWAAERGHEFDVVREPPRGEPPHDAVISLGSSASVLDGAHEEEAAFLRRTTRTVLGICFGAQLLAHALGGTVRRLDPPEARWARLDVDGLPDGPWLLWHEDAFADPPGADVLVPGVWFAHGAKVGVQFHPEATAEIARGWARFSSIPARAGVAVDELARDTDRAAAFALFDALLASRG